jgi:chromosome partitioning protein
MKRIIAISLSKGGVGKTTTAVNLAAALSLEGKRVLLVDTDTQGQAGRALGVNAATGLAEIVNGDIPWNSAVIQARPNLDLISGGPGLASVKRQIARTEVGGARILHRALEPINDSYDYAIVDTAPGWDSLQVNVLFYAREVLAPVPLETMAVQGLIDFMRRIKVIQTQNDKLQLGYVLPTGLDRRVKQSREIMDQLSERLGTLLCDPIRYNVRLSEAPAHGQHIYEYSPGCVGAADYAKLAQRIMSDE